MEKLKKRAWAFAGLFAVGGAYAHIATPDAAAGRTEPWLEKTALKTFGPYKMVPGTDPDQNVTYKMDKGTYEALAPFGIVCRDFTNGSSIFDVVLVASQAKDSFHDPRVCFTAQGWQLDQETRIGLPTSRGVFPVTIARIRSDQGERWAAFGYRTPYGFAGSTDQLKFQMFAYSLLHSRSADGVFYRFIGQTPDINRESLLKFIQKYMNASAKFSHNYL